MSAQRLKRELGILRPDVDLVAGLRDARELRQNLCLERHCLTKNRDIARPIAGAARIGTVTAAAAGNNPGAPELRVNEVTLALLFDRKLAHVAGRDGILT